MPRKRTSIFDKRDADLHTKDPDNVLAPCPIPHPLYEGRDIHGHVLPGFSSRHMSISKDMVRIKQAMLALVKDEDTQAVYEKLLSHILSNDPGVSLQGISLWMQYIQGRPASQAVVDKTISITEQSVEVKLEITPEQAEMLKALKLTGPNVIDVESQKLP